MSYGEDFRLCVVRNIEGGMPWDEAARIFSLSRDTIGRWLKRYRCDGTVADASRKTYKPRKISPNVLKEQLDNNPDATLEELADFFGCWPQSVHKRCVTLGITRKKKPRSTRRETRKSVKSFWPKSQS